MSDTYDLFFYPTGGGFEGREAHGTYPDPQPAREVANFPDPDDWKSGGTGVLVTDDAHITGDGRTYAEWHIEYRYVEDEPGGTVELRIVRGGQNTVTVDAVAYRDAVDNSTLGTLVADAVAATPKTLTVLGPNDDTYQLPPE